jgi:hypothetical protein
VSGPDGTAELAVALGANLVTDCYLLKRLQTSSAARCTRKYPCNRLLLGLGDGPREGGEVVIAKEDEAD